MLFYRELIEWKFLQLICRPTYFKFTDRQFEKLSGLRYLDVCYGEFDGSFESFILNLRCLWLTSCISIPTALNVKKLVVLHLDGCGVTDDWRRWDQIEVTS